LVAGIALLELDFGPRVRLPLQTKTSMMRRFKAIVEEEVRVEGRILLREETMGSPPPPPLPSLPPLPLSGIQHRLLISANDGLLLPAHSIPLNLISLTGLAMSPSPNGKQYLSEKVIFSTNSLLIHTRV
jgi:hypothetical protein